MSSSRAKGLIHPGLLYDTKLLMCKPRPVWQVHFHISVGTVNSWFWELRVLTVCAGIQYILTETLHNFIQIQVNAILFLNIHTDILCPNSYTVTRSYYPGWHSRCSDYACGLEDPCFDCRQPSLLFNGNRRIFPRGLTGEAWKWPFTNF